ncbi:MAG TPA: hypothetical protein VKW09_12820 [bacterium]|nr:hypothetical protein [bacterium]
MSIKSPTGEVPDVSSHGSLVAEVRDLARRHTALAIETLVHIMQYGNKDAARVVAAQALLDRAWGSAVQSLDVGGDTSLRIILDTPHEGGR